MRTRSLRLLVSHLVFLKFVLVFSIKMAWAQVTPFIEEETVTVSDEVEILVTKHHANGKALILWIAPSFGFRQGHNDMSTLLSSKGFEVWLADINEALFIPHNSTAMRKLTGSYVADLVEVAYKKTGKNIILFSGSYGAIPVLRGANRWLMKKPKNRYLLGTVLFSPNLYQSIPPLGTDPEYLPIVFASTIPIVIFQGSMNSNRWQVEKLADSLRIGGSSVTVNMMTDVVGLFYRKERELHVERYFHHFAENFEQQVSLFRNTVYTLHPGDIKVTKLDFGTGLDSQLKPYKGSPNPMPISLLDIHDKNYDIQEYKNRITIVNFWATWCPPCVKEIPSLNNLKKKMKGKPFELISINYAEKPNTIKEFLTMVNVDFPVLLDEEGLVAAKWKVIAFPSTFIIGTDGLIKYGVNAGIEWDTPEIINTLELMLDSSM